MRFSTSERLRAQGEEIRRLLATRTIVSLAAAADFAGGGYRIGRGDDRFLVAQARLTWLLSHASRFCLASTEEAARAGFRFLVEKQRDAEEGGFFWSVDPAGRRLDDRKFLYGQAFAIYALVEVARSFDRSALAMALDAFEVVNQRSHDDRYGGWIEHFDRRWNPLPSEERVPLERTGWKGANAHLHWMEALIELYRETGDRSVGIALSEVLAINETRFFSSSVGRTIALRNRDWSEPVSSNTLYGHIVEFAWMRLAARAALGQSPGWDEFHEVIERVRRMGAGRDGSLHVGPRSSDLLRRGPKLWWVQAEWLVALTTAAQKRPDDTSLQHFIARLVDSLLEVWIDKTDGLWLSCVVGHDRVIDRQKMEPCWKAGYHEVRAMRVFSQTFAGEGSATPAIFS